MTFPARDSAVDVEAPQTPADAVELSRASVVSIGLPTFNRASSLRKAIDSALSQDYRNIELVISDNDSSDGTQVLCEEYALRDNRVRYIHSSRIVE